MLLTSAEIEAVRRPYRSARLFPPRVFHDPEIFAFEQENWFGREWVCVGREDEAADRGEYFLGDVAGESVVVVRGGDDTLRAFHNVCRHRGSTILEEPCGRIARFQCPYHAWTYDLEGVLQRAKHTDDLEDFEPAENSLVPVRLETWQGFVFVSPRCRRRAAGQPARRPARALRSVRPVASLRRAKRIEYDVDANWKVIGENYSECYHCPGVHPQLNRLTPYDMGREFQSNGAWEGGWMELVGECGDDVDRRARPRPAAAARA